MLPSPVVAIKLKARFGMDTYAYQEKGTPLSGSAWLAGFIDANGTFTCAKVPDKRYNTGYKVEFKFIITHMGRYRFNKTWIFHRIQELLDCPGIMARIQHMKDEREILDQNTRVYWDTKKEVRNGLADRNVLGYLPFPIAMIHDYPVTFTLTRAPGIKNLVKYLNAYPLRSKTRIAFQQFTSLYEYNQNRSKQPFKDKVLYRVENLIKSLEIKDEDRVH